MNSPDKVGVRFVIEERDGQLSGRTYWEDPVTHQFEPEGEIVGTKTDGLASWTTESSVIVSGKFEKNRFIGTIVFPADGDEASHTTSLTLTR